MSYSYQVAARLYCYSGPSPLSIRKKREKHKSRSLLLAFRSVHNYLYNVLMNAYVERLHKYIRHEKLQRPFATVAAGYCIIETTVPAGTVDLVKHFTYTWNYYNTPVQAEEERERRDQRQELQITGSELIVQRVLVMDTRRFLSTTYAVELAQWLCRMEDVKGIYNISPPPRSSTIASSY
jgi:hypothetical protein